jgi:nitroreductase
MENPTLKLLSTRRSVKPDLLGEPGPSADEIATILTIASRVPDHKKLAPWRFIVLQGGARERLGETVTQACIAAEKEPPSDVRLTMERKRFLRAPVVIAVVSRTKTHPGAPEWEQILSAGAACLNLCLAANAMGYGTSWLTEWIAYDKGVGAALGLAETERVAGFIYIGTPTGKPDERERPVLSDIVTHWSGD